MIMHPRILRTIDANVNRVSEGLRVLEDISRFIVEDAEISRSLKEIRHGINQIAGNVDPGLIETRDAEGDIGSNSDITGDHKDVFSIVKANAKRAQEGMRVLEELSKLPELKAAMPTTDFKRWRYLVYTLEKQLIAELSKRFGT